MGILPGTRRQLVPSQEPFGAVEPLIPRASPPASPEHCKTGPLLQSRTRLVFQRRPELGLVVSLLEAGHILGEVIVAAKVSGDRFPNPGYLACYAATTARIHASDSGLRSRRLRPDVNRHLNWAFIEVVNVTWMHRRRHPDRHTSRPYNRLARGKGEQQAIGAVARHLAEVTYWVVKKRQPNCERKVPGVIVQGR